MSTSYEKKVVSLEFDDRNFTKNADRANQRLAELNQNLRFEDVEYRAQLLASSFDKSMQSMAQSTGDLTKALEKNSDAMSGYENAAEKMLKGMVSITYKMTDQITTSIANVGTSFLRQMTVGGMKQGMDMFESRIGSMQTIMANFTNYTESQIKMIFDDLNEYAKRTVYTQADMLQAIGKFSAQGVDPAAAAEAVKGISNVSALAGVGKSQNETAMYMLSQVISSGRMSGYQWRSLANSGWAGPFQRQLEKTLAKAIANGTATAAEKEAYGRIKGGENIRYTLESGWLTSNRILEVLQEFASTETEIGQTANEAAQSIKTFSQMLDNIRESITSEWNEIYSNVIGGLEDAKKLFTGIANIINNRTESAFADTIRTLKEFSESGGVKALRDLIHDLMLFVDQFLDPIQEAFDRIFGGNSGEDLAKNIAKIDEVVKGMFWSPESLQGIQAVFELIFGVLKLATSVLKGIGYLFRGISNVVNQIVQDIGLILAMLFDVDSEAAAFQILAYYIEDAFKNIATTIVYIFRLVRALITNPEGVMESFLIIGRYIITGLAFGIASGIDYVVGLIESLISGIKETTQDEFGIESPSKWMMWIGENLLLGLGIGLLLATPALKVTLGAVTEIIGSAFENIGVMLAGAGDFMSGAAKFAAIVGLLVAAFGAAYAFLPEEKVQRLRRMFEGLKDLINVVTECIVAILGVVTGKTIADTVASVVPWGGVNDMVLELGRSAKWAAMAQIIKSIGVILGVIMASVLTIVALTHFTNISYGDLVKAGTFIAAIILGITIFIKTILASIGQLSLVVNATNIPLLASKTLMLPRPVSETTKAAAGAGGIFSVLGSLGAIILAVAGLVGVIMATIVVLVGELAIIKSFGGDTSYIAGVFIGIGVMVAGILAGVDMLVQRLLRVSTMTLNSKSVAITMLSVAAVILAIQLGVSGILFSFTLLAATLAIIGSTATDPDGIIGWTILATVVIMVMLLAFVVVLNYQLSDLAAFNMIKFAAGFALLGLGIKSLIESIIFFISTFASMMTEYQKANAVYDDEGNLKSMPGGFSAFMVTLLKIIGAIISIGAILYGVTILAKHTTRYILGFGIGLSMLLFSIIFLMEEIRDFTEWLSSDANIVYLTITLAVFNYIKKIALGIAGIAGVLVLIVNWMAPLGGTLANTKNLVIMSAVAMFLVLLMEFVTLIVGQIAKVVKDNGFWKTVGGATVMFASLAVLITAVISLLVIIHATEDLFGPMTVKRLVTFGVIVGALLLVMLSVNLLVKQAARTIKDYGLDVLWALLTMFGSVIAIIATILISGAIIGHMAQSGAGLIGIGIVLVALIAIISTLSSLIANVVKANEAVKGASEAIDNLIKMFTELVDNKTIVNKAADVMTSIVDTLTKKLDKPAEEFRKKVHKVIDNVLHPKELGEYIAEGIAKGIKSASGKVSDALSDLSGKLKGTFSAEFDIHSPSKYMAEQGAFLVEGLKLGIKDGEKEVAVTWQDMIEYLKGYGALGKSEYQTLLNATPEEKEKYGPVVASKFDEAYDAVHESSFFGEIGKRWEDIGKQDNFFSAAWSTIKAIGGTGLDLLSVPASGVINMVAAATGNLAPGMSWSDAMTLSVMANNDTIGLENVVSEKGSIANENDFLTKLFKTDEDGNMFLTGEGSDAVNGFATNIVSQFFDGLVGEGEDSFIQRDENGKLTFKWNGLADSISGALNLPSWDDIKEELFGEGSLFNPDSFTEKIQEALGLNNDGLAGAMGQGLAGTGSSAVGNTYAFYQTNNSPKALSRSEIYRQTKNLFAQQKGVQQGIW